MNTPPRILVVEDDQIVAFGLQQSLMELGYPVVDLAGTGQAAIQLATQTRPDLILMDVRLPGQLDGIAAAEQILHHFDVPIIYLTAYADKEILERAKHTGPFGYISKPFHISTVQNNIEITLYKHQLERRLRQSEARFRILFEHAPTGILEVDSSQTPAIITRANKQARQMYGWQEDATQPVNRPLADLFLADEDFTLLQLKAALVRGQTLALETISVGQGGRQIPIRIEARTTESDPGSAIITIQDITIEAERQAATEAITAERQRIARDIHDGVAQTLASIRLKVPIWQDMIAENPNQLAHELEKCDALLGDTIREVRHAIFALNPVMLEQLGFFPAIRQFITAFAEQNGLEITLTVVGPEEAMPSALEPDCFRVVQEALNNVVKHANAQTVHVSLKLATDEHVVLKISDDGQGFSAVNLSAAKPGRQLGLHQMQARVARLNGSFSVKTEPGQGTTIHVSFPHH